MWVSVFFPEDFGGADYGVVVTGEHEQQVAQPVYEFQGYGVYFSAGVGKVEDASFGAAAHCARHMAGGSGLRTAWKYE